MLHALLLLSCRFAQVFGHVMSILTSVCGCCGRVLKRSHVSEGVCNGQVLRRIETDRRAKYLSVTACGQVILDIIPNSTEPGLYQRTFQSQCAHDTRPRSGAAGGSHRNGIPTRGYRNGIRADRLSRVGSRPSDVCSSPGHQLSKSFTSQIASNFLELVDSL